MSSSGPGWECAIEYQSLSKIPGPSAAAGGTQAAGGAAATGGNPATSGPLSPMAVPLWATPIPGRQLNTG